MKDTFETVGTGDALPWISEVRIYWTRDSLVSRHLIFNIWVERAQPEATGAAPARHPGPGKDPNKLHNQGAERWRSPRLSWVFTLPSQLRQGKGSVQSESDVGIWEFCSRRRHWRSHTGGFETEPVWDQMRLQSGLMSGCDLKVIWSDLDLVHLWAAGFLLVLQLLMSCCWGCSSIFLFFFYPLSLLFTRLFNFYSLSALCCVAIC